MKRRSVNMAVFLALQSLAGGLHAQSADMIRDMSSPAQDTSVRPLASHSPKALRFTPADPPSARREPLVAGALGVLPGLGHVYADESHRGLVVFGVWIGSALIAFSSSNKIATSAGTVGLLGSHIFSVVDASRAARRFNRRHGR